MRLVALSVVALKFVLMCLDKWRWSCAGPGIQQSVLGNSHRHGKLIEHDSLFMHQIVHPIRNGFLIRYPKQLTIGSTSLRGSTFRNLGKLLHATLGTNETIWTNLAPSDVNATLDGSTCPGWKTWLMNGQKFLSAFDKSSGTGRAICTTDGATFAWII